MLTRVEDKVLSQRNEFQAAQAPVLWDKEVGLFCFVFLRSKFLLAASSLPLRRARCRQTRGSTCSALLSF